MWTGRNESEDTIREKSFISPTSDARSSFGGRLDSNLDPVSGRRSSKSPTKIDKELFQGDDYAEEGVPRLGILD